MRRSLSLVVSTALVALGCGGPVDPHSDGGMMSCTAANQDTDIAQYVSVEQQLEANRTMALGRTASLLEPHGDYLYWQDTTNLTPTLHRMHSDSSQRVDYAFSIGTGDFANYRAENSLVITAQPAGSGVEYRAYDAAQANMLVGTASFPAPGSGVRWYAYAVDGGDVYIVKTDTPGTTALLKWTPSTGGMPTQITTLESAGATVGEFIDFDVSGNTMIFIESGRIWRMDLAANHAEWLHNMTEVLGHVEFGPDGVLFDSATSLLYFDTATQMITNVSDSIHSAPYRFNCTFNSIHYFSQDFTRWGSWVIYIAGDGVFAYNLQTQAIQPVLLDTRDAPFITYRYPVVLPDGTMFVTGLTSTSGATGADGPVYRVNLSAILH